MCDTVASKPELNKGLILDYHILEGYTALQDGTCCLHEETKGKKKSQHGVSFPTYGEFCANAVCIKISIKEMNTFGRINFQT